MKILHPLLCLSAALLFSTAVTVSPGSAADKRHFFIDTTEDLLELCATPADDPLRAEAINYCMAYIDGSVDYHDAIADHEDMQRLICYDETATLASGVLDFIRWGETHRGDEDLMGEPSVIGVVRALAARWPCNP